MQPLGYYGIKCEPQTEKVIDGLDLDHTCGLLAIISEEIREELTNSSYQGIHHSLVEKCAELCPLQRLALIRALCDRIELKLMEIAK